jgi:hypothetical protein
LTAERFSKGILPIISAFLFLFLSYGLLKLIDNKISGGKTFYPVITEIIDCPEKENKNSSV